MESIWVFPPSIWEETASFVSYRLSLSLSLLIYIDTHTHANNGCSHPDRMHVLVDEVEGDGEA